jgi:hypothetical protein
MMAASVGAGRVTASVARDGSVGVVSVEGRSVVAVVVSTGGRSVGVSVSVSIGEDDVSDGSGSVVTRGWIASSVANRRGSIAGSWVENVSCASTKTETIKHSSTMSHTRRIITMSDQQGNKEDYGMKFIIYQMNEGTIVQILRINCDSKEYLYCATETERSIATNRWSLPSSVCTSAISMWKYPMVLQLLFSH